MEGKHGLKDAIVIVQMCASMLAGEFVSIWIVCVLVIHNQGCFHHRSFLLLLLLVVQSERLSSPCPNMRLEWSHHKWSAFDRPVCTLSQHVSSHVSLVFRSTFLSTLHVNLHRRLTNHLVFGQIMSHNHIRENVDFKPFVVIFLGGYCMHDLGLLFFSHILASHTAIIWTIFIPFSTFRQLYIVPIVWKFLQLIFSDFPVQLALLRGNQPVWTVTGRSRSHFHLFGQKMGIWEEAQSQGWDAPGNVARIRSKSEPMVEEQTGEDRITSKNQNREIRKQDSSAETRERHRTMTFMANFAHLRWRLNRFTTFPEPADGNRLVGTWNSLLLWLRWYTLDTQKISLKPFLSLTF